MATVIQNSNCKVRTLFSFLHMKNQNKQQEQHHTTDLSICRVTLLLIYCAQEVYDMMRTSEPYRTTYIFTIPGILPGAHRAGVVHSLQNWCRFLSKSCHVSARDCLAKRKHVIPPDVHVCTYALSYYLWVWGVLMQLVSKAIS